jgi:FAD-dependent oxidoreductase domain-containing protein 1
MSLFGAEFLRNIKQHLSVEGHDPPDVQFTPYGYLLLASEKGAQQLEENARLQR